MRLNNTNIADRVTPTRRYLIPFNPETLYGDSTLQQFKGFRSCNMIFGISQHTCLKKSPNSKFEMV